MLQVSFQRHKVYLTVLIHEILTEYRKYISFCFCLDSDNDFESANTSLVFSPPKEQTSNLNKSGCSSQSTAKPDVQIIKVEERRTEIEPEGSLDSTPTAFLPEEKSLFCNTVGESKTSEEIVLANDSFVTKPNLLNNDDDEHAVEQDSMRSHGDLPSQLSIESSDWCKADIISKKLTFESPVIKKDEVIIYHQFISLNLFLKNYRII